MTDISPASLKMLKKLRKLEYLPEDQMPLKFDRYRLQYLVDIGLVETFTLIPPGQEGYDRGLVAYKLSPQGEDSIYKYRKVEIEARIALLIAIVSIIITLLTTFTPIEDWADALFKETAAQQTEQAQQEIQ